MSTVLPATSDFKSINGFYQSADLMIRAGRFGKSFGHTLAEAMVAGLPIITLTTAWSVDVQTDLVFHGFGLYPSKGFLVFAQQPGQ